MVVMVGGAKQLIGGMPMVGTNKALGQHWLKNRQILDQIADLAANGSAYASSEKTMMNSGSVCLEIGPGLGTLTSSLLRRFSKVIAVEYDERLAINLPKSFPGKNLEVINGDILQFDFDTIEGEYSVAGNIPYYITSPIIEKLLTVPNLPKRIVLLIQKEVAERIVSDKETGLSLFVKNRAKVFAGPIVPRKEFTPPPKVDSEVIVMEPHAPIVDEKVFDLIRKGFSAPRKKLIHNLSAMASENKIKETLVKININPNSRPEDLHLLDWQKLFLELK